MNEYSLLLVDLISSGAISLPLILYWDILGSDHYVRRRGGEFGSFECEAKPAEFTLFVIALPFLYFCNINCPAKLLVLMVFVRHSRKLIGRRPHKDFHRSEDSCMHMIHPLPAQVRCG